MPGTSVSCRMNFVNAGRWESFLVLRPVFALRPFQDPFKSGWKFKNGFYLGCEVSMKPMSSQVHDMPSYPSLSLFVGLHSAHSSAFSSFSIIHPSSPVYLSIKPLGLSPLQVVVKTRTEYQTEKKRLKVPKVEEFTISFTDGVSERLKVRASTDQ